MTNETRVLRAIKSFVRRTGRVTPAQKYALQQYWQSHGISFDAHSTIVRKLAANFDGLKLEIGFGNGDALIHMAANDPTSLYLGIEVHEPGIGRCLKRIESAQLNNVKLLSHDAIEVMQTMLMADSLDAIFLFFPDPWHKKRHHKRRIVNPQFRDLCARLLKSGGFLHLATDWQDYAEHMALELLSDARFVNRGNSKGVIAAPSYRPSTKFEQRGIKLGHGVWDLLFSKRE